MFDDKTTKDIGLRGIEVADTNICLIEGSTGRLYYRGYDISDLAESSSYEEVVYLLIHGDLPTTSQLEEFSSTLKANRELPPEIIDQLQKTPTTAPSMNVLQSAFAILASFDPEFIDDSMEANRRKVIRIIAKIPGLVAAWERIRNTQSPISPMRDLSHAANFLYMLKGEEPESDIARIFDMILILHAEHSFNASTFTARVIASTGADLYAAISGAIGSLSGRFHGGANALVMKNLLEIGDLANVEEWVRNQFDTGKRIMGMGHAVYKVMDPRAKILKKMFESMLNGKADVAYWLFSITNKMVEVTQDEFMKRKRRTIYPNVDLYSASVYSMLRIPMEAFTPIFALSRAAGWCAHALEEKFPETPEIKPVLYRPSADYIGKYCGPLGCKFVPLELRETISRIS
ncbi:MAG: citrate (Si)-synthase [Candidatus Heimdallarchaeota archaeon]|nr:MAG: citrate (Si)-synthase [Candidatus Heimdallarchaeota archaeon]